MDMLGSAALVLALVAAGYAFVAGIVGIAGRRPSLTRVARYSFFAAFGAVSFAVAILWYLLLSNDFSIAYVAEHSSRTLPAVYKFAALWAGQEGSLLFWSWLLSIFAVIALIQNRDKHSKLMPTVTVVLAGIQAFFLILNNFVASPFAVLGVAGPTGTRLVSLADGQGLNPLLQYAEMIIHPPLLYLGYTGFAVPFAFALAAMLRKEPADGWIHIARRWTLVAWCFLGVGILLGAHWAYAVLGWGGYWAWDPVENASLLPWLTGTALLHSMIVQERRGMMRRSSLWLMFATFWLSVFGTFLTRSGVVNSVHAFAKSSLGTWLIVFLGVLFAVCAWASLRNRESLETQRHLDSFFSREATLFFGILLLLLACLGVLCGTLFPVLSEWTQGTRITVGPPFFDQIVTPIAFVVLLLMGVTPFLAWGPNSSRHLRRDLALSAVVGALTSAAVYWFGFRRLDPLVCLGLGTFAAMTILLQFVHGARLSASLSQSSPFVGLRDAIMGDTRRYGGYVAHLGIVLMLIGISGQAFNRDTLTPMKPGDEVTIGPYTLVSQTFDQIQTDSYQGVRATIEVLENGRSTMMLYPERRFYPASQETETQVAIYSSMARDLYVAYEGDSPKDNLPMIHVHVNPLVRWIWFGGSIMLLGIMLCLMPSEGPLARTQEVKVAIRSKRQEPVLVSQDQ
jgi:cytochrome c-type biogenesis protein CcmF